MIGASITFFQVSHSVDRGMRVSFRTILAAQQMNSAVQDLKDANSMLSGPATSKSDAQKIFQTATTAFDKALATAKQAVATKDQRSVLDSIAKIYPSVKGGIAEQITPNRSYALMPGETAAELDEIQSQTQKLIDLSRLAIEQDNQLARDDAEGSFWKSVAITVISTVFAAIVATLMIRRILTPLAALAKHAERIAAGDLSPNVEKPGIHEIGALTDSFNEMAAKLAEVRKSENRKMERLERINEAAVESLYDPIIVTDAKGRIFRLNKAAQSIFGSVPQSPRKSVHDHISDKRIQRAIEHAITEQETSAGEDESALVQLKVNDEIRTYRLRVTPMKMDDNRLVGSVTVLEDITYLRVVDKLKTEFIGVASHELRTPVTSLLLSSEILRDGSAGPLTDAQKSVLDAQQQDLEQADAGSARHQQTRRRTVASKTRDGDAEKAHGISVLEPQASGGEKRRQPPSCISDAGGRTSGGRNSSRARHNQPCRQRNSPYAAGRFGDIAGSGLRQ